LEKHVCTRNKEVAMESRMLTGFRGSSVFTLLGALLVAASLAWAAVPATGQENATAGSSVSPAPTTIDQATGSVVPRLIKFSGVVKDATGKVQTGAATLTFSLYEEQESGAPLWVETQSVQLDEQGQYTVLLGATQPQGLPLDLFATGQARWLGVQPALSGVGEQPRVLLVGVPYALKAADADTLGGKPLSAFVTTDSQTSSPQASASAATTTTGPSTSAKPGQGVQRDSATSSSSQSTASVGGSGTTNFIPQWTNSTTLGNSLLFQMGANVGLGTTTPAQKFEVDSGNMLVRGPNNFKGAGNTAFLYVGDTHHPIEAIWNSGLAIGAWKVPQALFIQDQTGNVGIGTTTPTGAILSTVATSMEVVGLATAGWSAPFGSNLPGNDAIHTTGGEGDNSGNGQPGGAGVVATGGAGLPAGEGVIANGGGSNEQYSPGAAAVVATGGGGFPAGEGVVLNRYAVGAAQHPALRCGESDPLQPNFATIPS
jgi:hypothetical protein